MSILGIFVAYIFVSNVVLTRFLGLCPYFGVSKDLGSAVGMGAAVTFVLSLASLASSALYTLVLVPLGLEFLKLLSFIFVIAVLVQFVELLMQKFSPALHQVLGVYLPLITTNCAVLGVALWNVDEYNIAQSTLAGFAAGLGFTLVLVLMAGIRLRLQLERVPRFLRGAPIAFISAGLMALGFYAFDWSLLENLGLR